MAGCITGTAEGGSGNDVGDTKSILQHNAHFLDKRYQKGRQRVAQKRHLLHHVDHVTVSRFFLARVAKPFVPSLAGELVATWGYQVAH